MDNRVYGKKVDLDSSKIEEFYNERARTLSKRKSEYTTVLLGDQDPDYADRWDAFEKEFITPKLNLRSSSKVLDLGCGIGRWADSISDSCEHYTGVDFSEEMVKVATDNHDASKCSFYAMSVKDALMSEVINKDKYDVVIITGVLMYMNDADITACASELYNVLNDGGILYIEESVGKKERLTLDQIWSEALQSSYNAIYRTRAEYQEMLSSVIGSCKVIEDGYMDALDKSDMSETGHWYTILKKGE